MTNKRLHYLGITADMAPPKTVKLIVTLQYFTEHLRVVLGVERFVATQSVTINSVVQL